MTWFKTDDKFWSSPERLSASWAAIGVWVTAGSYCSDQLTDGIVSKNAQKLLRIRPKTAQELVAVGLWIAHENGDYEFKNWPKFNPMKAEVEARREQLREAGRAGGKRSGQSRNAARRPPEDSESAKHDASISLSIMPSATEALPVELPTRPVPTTAKAVVREPRSRAIALPVDWMPDRAVINAMKAECPGADLEGEHRKFVDWAHANGKTMRDWNAAWRNWVRRAAEGPGIGRRASRGPTDPTLTPAEIKFAKAEALKDNPDPAILAAAGIPMPDPPGSVTRLDDWAQAAIEAAS